MKSLAPIETPRATLREVVKEDLEMIHTVLGDPSTSGGRSFFQSDLESTARWLARRIADHEAHGYGMWCVEERGSLEIVGLAGLFPGDTDEVEVGYVIRSDRQGVGLASEVVGSIVEVASREGLSLFATIRTGNYASIKVATRCGFERSDVIDDERGQLLIFRLPVMSRFRENEGEVTPQHSQINLD